MAIDSNTIATSTAARLINGETAPVRSFARSNSTSKPRGTAHDLPVPTLDSKFNPSDATANEADAGFGISDIDAADKSIHDARTDILTRSSTAMLAQANLSPAKVLQLLQ